MTLYDATQYTCPYCNGVYCNPVAIRTARTLWGGSRTELCKSLQFVGFSTQGSRSGGCQGDSSMARDREGMEEFELDNTI